MAINQNKLNDLFGEDWGSDFKGDIELDDSGDLIFGAENSDESEDSNDLNEDESDEADAESTDDNSEASDGEDEPDSGESDEPDPVESRFQTVESSVDKLTDMVEKLVNQIGQKSKPQDQDLESDDDDDDLPLTRKELQRMMKKTVEEAVKPFNQQTQEQKELVVVQNLQNTYGEEFVKAVPAMKKLLISNPALGVQGAWDLVSEIKGIKKPTSKATKLDSGNKKVLLQKKGDAAQLREKAAKLDTTKGATSGTQKGEKRRAVGIDNIIKQSWDEMLEN
jgi:hypothetical protein